MLGSKKRIAVIGSGATTIYLLKHILDHISDLSSEICDISIFEKDSCLGMGMPYNPKTTDIYNMSNISSEEIPELFISFSDWLDDQDDDKLEKFNIRKSEISKTDVYSRIALGSYFHSRFKECVTRLKRSGINILEFSSTEIIDIKPLENGYALLSNKNKEFITDKVIIATGHEWKEKDYPKTNFYGSPWPISKILPASNEIYNFPIGILGASLSAFDVVSSLSNRHGNFIHSENETRYLPNAKTENFKLILHDANGWLPHLQYEQVEPMRKIYRHTTREGIIAILDKNNLLRIDTFFEIICKPALQKAFLKDNLSELAIKLKNKKFGFKEFVDRMSERHEYQNAFEGMRKEMQEAQEAMQNRKPMYWKEVIDDLMYCLNYHIELLPAEDNIFFQKEVKPFLMNVIAALPLKSGKMLLALYDAGKIELKSGLVEIEEPNPSDTLTKINVSKDGEQEEFEYKMFICCGGQKNLELKDYPFKSLVNEQYVRAAAAIKLNDKDDEIKANEVLRNDSNLYIELGGIDIDSSYRIVNENGISNEDIFDISFTHSSGLRPYSYGLQACSATTEIMVESWVNSIKEVTSNTGTLKNVSKVYAGNVNL